MDERPIRAEVQGIHNGDRLSKQKPYGEVGVLEILVLSFGLS